MVLREAYIGHGECLEVRVASHGLNDLVQDRRVHLGVVVEVEVSQKRVIRLGGGREREGEE